MKSPVKHILVVDDNPVNRKLVVAILEAEGHTTVQAADGAEALSLMDTTKVDAIISDILMPNMDGYRFCFEVRKSRRHSTLPFLFHSATYTSPTDEKLAIELGADKVLKKPVSSAGLLNALDEVFNSPAYQKPRVITQPKTIEVIKEYRDALVRKLEEKTVELQKTTEELKASEELFRLITENAADLIAVLDPEGRRLYNSPSYHAFLGVQEALHGTDSFREIHPDDRERIKSIFRDTVATGVGHREEFRFVLNNGAIRHIESQGSAVRDSAGKTVKVVVVSRDVTERVKAEETLRTLSNAVEQAGDSIIITDKHGVIEYVNPAFERTTGYSKDLAIGKTPKIVKSGEQSDEYYKNLWQTILSGKVFRDVVVNRKRNGQLFYEEQTITPIVDVRGEIIHFVSTGRDITERRKAEQDLVESTERFQQLADAIKEVFWLTGMDRNEMLYVSRGYEEIWGRTRDSLFANPISWAEAIHADDRERVLQNALLKQKEGMYDEVYRIVRPDGSVRWIHDQAFPVRNQNDEVIRIAGIAEDITERKSLEEQLRQAQKLESLGTLAGGIAHDFNNILGIIMGHGALMRRGKTDPVRVSKSAEMIEQSAQRGAALVRQLLTFARKSDVTLESVILNDVVAEVAKLLEETLPRVIAISMNLKKQLPSIVADATQVHQVLLNLCVNARDAMLPQGGILSIGTELLTGDVVRKRFPKANVLEYVLLRITDTGSGMNEVTRQRIFEPFFTTKEKGKGTGLGLATVYGIVESHKGFVDVVSEVGRGTTFLVYFPVPLLQLGAQGVPAGSADEIRGGTETVLVVEDEEMLRVLSTSILELAGYKVLKAGDGAKALSVYTKSHANIALVLTDLGLPKVGGEMLIEGLKEINAAVRIIVMSGYIEPEHKTNLFKIGVKDIISKPFRPDDLLRKVREVLDRKTGN